jgi:hypothetical protein
MPLQLGFQLSVLVRKKEPKKYNTTKLKIIRLRALLLGIAITHQARKNQSAIPQLQN